MSTEKTFPIKVEKGIPLPPQPRRTGQPGLIKRTLLGMEKGDSFVVPDTRSLNRVRQHAQDLKIIVAARQENGKQSFRVWHDGTRSDKTKKKVLTSR